MISREQLITIKERLNGLVIKDVRVTLRALKKELPKGNDRYVEVLNLEGRYNELNKSKIKQIISVDDEQLMTNQLRSDLITLIAELELEDFEKPATTVLGLAKGSTALRVVYALLGLGIIALAVILIARVTNERGEWFTLPTAKKGQLLYKIPTRMQLGRETECIVRIAYDSAGIFRNLSREEVVVESIRTSEKMKVQLVRSDSIATFRVRNKLISDEQFIERKEFTEWRFGVTPLLAGAYDLMIKVTVLKNIEGKEVERFIVYNQKIEIVSGPIAATELPFQATGHVVSTSAMVGGGVTGNVIGRNPDTEPVKVPNPNPITPMEEAEAIEALDHTLTIYFPSSSAGYDLVDEQTTEYLLRLAKRARQTGEKIILTGHTDRVGTETRNVELGKQRAAAVASLLRSKGVDDDLIVIGSKGSSDPVASNDTEAGRRLNRRVEVGLGRGN